MLLFSLSIGLLPNLINISKKKKILSRKVTCYNMLMDVVNLRTEIPMNSNNLKSTLKRRGKSAPDETVYTASEAAKRLGVHNSTFQNYVRAKRVRKVIPLGKKEGFYPKEDVEKLAEELQKQPSRRRKQQKQLAVISTTKSVEEATTDWIQYEDELNAYNLDCELYGFENSVSPDITWTWWQKNSYACRILYNKKDRSDIWGLLSIIPMEEETIFKLLRDQMSEKDILPEHVLVYEPGKHYSCYVAAVSMRPEHKHSFAMLLHSTMQFWLAHPEVHIDKLFAFALGSDGMQLIRKMFFWPRRDISDNAWELDFSVMNPNKAIEEYRRNIQDARNSGKKNKKALSLQSIATVSVQNEMPVSVILEPALIEDIPSVMEISKAIYGNSGTSFERRVEWLQKNPEYLYIVKQQNEQAIGYASIMPLELEQIRRILSEEIHPGDIIADQLKEFKLGSPIDIYIASLAVKPGLPEKIETKCGFELVKHLMDFFADLGRRNISIRYIFARSRTLDGIKILTRMGFTEIESTAHGPQHHFMVDVEQSGLHFIKRYKELRETQNN